MNTVSDSRRDRASGAGECWLRWLHRLLWSSWRRWQARPPRQLRLCETLALGDRRFLVVVEFGRQKLLIGSTSNALALLAELQDASAASAAPAGAVPMSGIRLARAKDAAE